MVKQSERELAGQIRQTAQRVDQDNDASFFVDNYGGLNKTAPTVNIPYTDSSEMVNMKVNLAGTLSKRNGSFVRQALSGQLTGSMLANFTLDSGHLLLVTKIGTSLSVYLAPPEDSTSTLTLIKTFSNVFPSGASKTRPSIVWTTEDRPRLIMVGSNFAPVELEIMEAQMTGDGDTTIAVPGDYTEDWAETNTYGIYEETVVDCTNITHSTGTSTFTFASNIPNLQIISAVQLCWHWWAESLKRTAAQVYESTFRFNTSVNADANVEIPEEVRRGLEADSTILSSLLSYGQKLVRVYQDNTATPTEFTFDTTPSTDTEFAYSNQVYTTGGATDYITPGTSYLTFGGIAGAGANPPTPVHIVRQIYLPFNGGEKVPAEDLTVVDSTGFEWEALYNATRSANTTSNKYFWVLDDTLAVETTDTDEVRILEFSGGYPYGVDEQFVEIVNGEPNTSWTGSGAVNTYYSPKTEGSYRPWYGASLYANFRTGVFPSVVGLYQDRLVLTGFSSAPMTVLFSNVADNGSRWRYQNFQVDFDDTTLADNPVEINLDGITQDRVTGVMPWFNSLFVLTEYSTRRIYGGDNVAITPTNSFQNSIGSVGCQSVYGVVSTDRNVMFISNSGLYAIEILEQTGDYYTNNIGLKIEDLFIDNSKFPKQSWAFYNQKDDEVWIGLSSGADEYVCDKVIVLFNKREAFSEYTLFNGFMYSIVGTADTDRKFIGIVNRDTDIGTEPTSSSQLLITEFDLEDMLTDLTYKETNSNMESGSTTYAYHTRVEVTVTDNSQRSWSLIPSKCPANFTNHGFRIVPLADQETNIRIRRNNGISWENITYAASQWTPYYQQNVYNILMLPYNDNDKLDFLLLNDNGDQPIHVIRDNFELNTTDDYDIDENGDYLRVTLKESGDTDAVYLVGATIPCWHFTPTFFRQLNPLLKRGVHYVGYYANTRYSDFFEYEDINQDASQAASEIVDRFKYPVGIKLGVLYNDSRTGSYDSEVYGEEDLIWDSSLFDFPSTSFRNQLNEVVRVTIPLIGVGYSFQNVNYNYSLDRFELVGYHVLTRRKGRNSVYWY